MEYFYWVVLVVSAYFGVAAFTSILIGFLTGNHEKEIYLMSVILLAFISVMMAAKELGL